MTRSSNNNGDADALATQALVLADAMRPLLAGNDPATQGGALGELVATFLLAHAPDLRKRMLTLHVELVSDLVAHAVKGGHDPWQRKRKPGT